MQPIAWVLRPAQCGRLLEAWKAERGAAVDRARRGTGEAGTLASVVDAEAGLAKRDALAYGGRWRAETFCWSGQSRLFRHMNQRPPKRAGDGL